MAKQEEKSDAPPATNVNNPTAANKPNNPGTAPGHAPTEQAAPDRNNPPVNNPSAANDPRQAGPNAPGNTGQRSPVESSPRTLTFADHARTVGWDKAKQDRFTKLASNRLKLNAGDIMGMIAKWGPIALNIIEEILAKSGT